MPQTKSKSKKSVKPKPERRRTVKRTPPLQVALEEWARLNRLQRAESLAQRNRLHEVTVKDIAELGGEIKFSPSGTTIINAEKDRRIKEMLSAREQVFLSEGRALDAANDGFRGIRHLFSEPSEKKTFTSGATRSGNLDERYDLISPEANRRRALTYGHGARVHGDRNWENGMPVSECLNRAIRHINLYLAGDTSEDHLAHASVNLDFAMHFEEHNHECVDCGPFVYKTQRRDP